MPIKKTKSRIIFFQSVYALLFAGKTPSTLELENLGSDALSFFEETFGENEEKKIDKKFFSLLSEKFSENWESVFSEIRELAKEWPFEEIPLVDKASLVLGITEMIYVKETPYKVAIDEAINIAKMFKGESANKLVNGVLASVFKKYLEKNEEQS